MSTGIDEGNAVKDLSIELRKTRTISEEQKQKLQNIFKKRLTPALAIVEEKRVARYQFEPSRRSVWIVTGRKGQYQVIPESMFCTCDDYHFRVMENKKQLCYHILAQQIAEPLGKYIESNLPDTNYSRMMSKWGPASSPEK